MPFFFVVLQGDGYILAYNLLIWCGWGFWVGVFEFCDIFWGNYFVCSVSAKSDENGPFAFFSHPKYIVLEDVLKSIK